jgi:hypothetical protein
MTAIVMTWLACWLAMAIAPDVPVSRALHRWMVLAPAARLLALSRGDVAMMLVLAIAAAIMLTVGKTDSVRLVTFALPDLAMWLTSLELSALFDLAVAVLTAVTAVRGTGLIGGMIGRRRRPRAARRARQVRSRQSSASNDDDGGRAAVALVA